MMWLKLAVILLPLLFGIFAGFPTDMGAGAPPDHVPGELLAMTDTREDAERIAALYDVELYSFDNGLAVFHTHRDVNEVIALGESKGWPPLSRNDVITLD